jgi:hypothetical protein
MTAIVLAVVLLWVLWVGLCVVVAHPKVLLWIAVVVAAVLVTWWRA